ncbi:putative lactone hydrolase [Thozetella sp. PMI_491]|nr:putative lactone hydrolase [Thozetella sp. PMI_491]
MGREIKTIVTNISYGEGPRWHDGRLWFADFYTHQVLSVREDGGDLRVEAVVPEQPSGLGWLPDGRLLVISMRDAKILRREPSGALETHADLSAHVGGLLNDMLVDPAGRAYVGNFGFDLMHGAPLAPTALLLVQPDGHVLVATAPDLWFPNGTVLTPDGKTLLVAESFGNRISAFGVDLHSGALGHRRDWATFGPPPADRELAKVQLAVMPDGCCLDSEGCIWLADSGGQRLLRVREGGEIVEQIDIDGRTLFACSAPDFHEETRRNVREAKILAVQVDVPRAGAP